MGVIAVAILGSALFSVWLIPVYQTLQLPGVTDSKDRALVENEYRKTLVQIVGGVLVVVGLSLTVWRMTILSRQVSIQEDGQITERFTMALGMLGNKESSSIRIGAIYALGRIGADSRKDQQTVLDILSACVRDQTTWRNENEEPQMPTDEVQAAMRVITGRRQPTDDGWRLNLKFVNLDGINLVGAYLEMAILSPAQLLTAKMRSARLRGADLRSVEMVGVDLSDADLRGAQLYGARIQGLLRRADLRETSWFGAHVQATVFENARFDGSDLSGGQFQDTNLRGASLCAVKLAQLTEDGESLQFGVNLERADLRGADLAGVQYWRGAESMKGMNIFGVRNAPRDFKAMALHFGAVEVESNEEWGLLCQRGKG